MVVSYSVRPLTNQYDRLNRLIQIDDGSKSTSYTYDKNSNRSTCSAPNGLLTTNIFDALNRATQMLTAASSAFPTPPSTSIVYKVSYAYDLANNRLSNEEKVSGQPLRQRVYTYDQQYRLLSETSGPNSNTFDYDDLGNRFDLVGNRVRRVQGGTFTTNTLTTIYVYDDLNRLLKIGRAHVELQSPYV